MHKYRLIALALWAICATAAHAANVVSVTVRNSLNVDRTCEMVELDAAKVAQRLGTSGPMVVRDASGHEVPSQTTHDGKLIFQAGVKAKDKAKFTIEAGTPHTYPARVFGKQYPERLDDFAWENDRVAYRCYGPALQRKGERAFGYDIWTKSTDRMVVDERYALQHNKQLAETGRRLGRMGYKQMATDIGINMSFHVDHGTGMDVYQVGPTLGAGTNALLDHNGEIVYPWCYTSVEVLDRGPLRLAFRLTYETKDFEGRSITEHRTITLDAGSHLNKATVSYSGLSTTEDVAVGIVIHKQSDDMLVDKDKRFFAYADAGDPSMKALNSNRDFGQIFVGVLLPQQPDKVILKPLNDAGNATGHLLGISKIEGEAPFTYYFGSGWSKNANTSLPDIHAWKSYLEQQEQCLDTPLKVSMK